MGNEEQKQCIYSVVECKKSVSHNADILNWSELKALAENKSNLTQK